MSFNFNNNINPTSAQFKAQSAYKDGSGMGGGGMYFQQGKKKRGDQPEEDIFEFKDEKKKEDPDYEMLLGEEDIPRDNLFNKFVNWFRKEDN